MGSYIGNIIEKNSKIIDFIKYYFEYNSDENKK